MGVRLDVDNISLLDAALLTGALAMDMVFFSIALLLITSTYNRNSRGLRLAVDRHTDYNECTHITAAFQLNSLWRQPPAFRTAGKQVGPFDFDVR
jgi:hypothetical protein